jgi:predicted 2-oxoglutarate/Fe(II)-dependent dioxygenase YbiX
MALSPGDPCPAFRTAGNSNPNYVFSSAAGRYLVLAVLSGEDHARFEAVLAQVAAVRSRFDDETICFFGLIDHDADWRSRARDETPGVRWLFDSGEIRPLLGGAEVPGWLLIDPSFRVLATASLDQGPALLASLDKLPPVDRHGGEPVSAPVLTLPRIFEPEFCAALIAHYDRQGGEASGFMREVDGVTRLMHDRNHKRRKDVILEPGVLTRAVQARISSRLVPQIEKAFQFRATRIERYLVAAYEAEDGGVFRPHRDNTTKGTAHRRFAVSINLNADYDGGDLRFPEFGSRTYRPPPGGATVFSCSLLHEATTVTRGRRYAFLPFLYDEAAAAIRVANLKYIEGARPSEAQTASIVET